MGMLYAMGNVCVSSLFRLMSNFVLFPACLFLSLCILHLPLYCIILQVVLLDARTVII